MSYDLPACPGPECPWCTGGGCMACGGGYGQPARPKGPCAHDAQERHTSPPRTPEEREEQRQPKNCALWLELAALSDDSPGPWAKADLFRMAREASEVDLTDAELEAGLKESTLKVRGSKVGL